LFVTSTLPSAREPKRAHCDRTAAGPLVDAAHHLTLAGRQGRDPADRQAE